MSVKQNEDLTSDCEYNKLEDQVYPDQAKPKVSERVLDKKQSVMFALLAGVCYALANYIIGGKSNLGFLAAFSSNAGNLVFALVAIGSYIVKQSYTKQTIWSWESSYFRHPEGGLNTFNLIIVCLYILVNMAASFLVVFTFKFALKADVNQGILTSLFGLTAFFSAVASYFLFGEKLKIAHMVGIVFMILCAVGLGFGTTSFNTEETATTTLEIVEASSSRTTFAILSIIFAILCPISFCSGGMVVRIGHQGPKLKEGAGYKFNTLNSTDMAIMMYVGINIFFIILTIVNYETNDHPFDILEYLQMAAAGLIAAVGVVSMNHALIVGLAGPVFALCNCQVIIQAALDAVFLGNIPNALEIVSAVLGIIGACILALFG